MTAAIVDTTTIGKVILYSVVAGIGTAFMFGLGVWSVGGLLDAIRQRRSLAGTVWGLLTALCIAATVGAVALGIAVTTSKS